MNAGVIGYLNSKNIGDYVQTLSVINLINQGYTILERENLNNYKGKKTKTIINGWFMENPLKFPPSKHIDPIFISFHINPSIEKEFLNPKTIDSGFLQYSKAHFIADSTAKAPVEQSWRLL